jgi:hypothetical protein
LSFFCADVSFDDLKNGEKVAYSLIEKLINERNVQEGNFFVD